MPDGGDNSIFEQTVLPHLDAAYNVARYLLRDDADAHDVVQESAMRALRYFPTFRGQRSDDALPWLLRIVRNTAYTLLQKKRPTEPLPDDSPDLATPDPSAASSTEVDVEALRAAVDALPPEFREVIVLRELEGMSYKQIASATDVSIGTVMSRLARARKKLQCLVTHASTEVDHHGM